MRERRKGGCKIFCAMTTLPTFAYMYDIQMYDIHVYMYMYIYMYKCMMYIIL